VDQMMGLTAMIWVVPSGAGLTRRLTGLVP
jgi:hypothetical protein